MWKSESQRFILVIHFFIILEELKQLSIISTSSSNIISFEDHQYEDLESEMETLIFGMSLKQKYRILKNIKQSKEPKLNKVSISYST
eukprot:gene89-4338_t